MRNFLIVFGAALALGGCGGEDRSPTGPSPTASSILVELQDVVLVGRTAIATATATLTNGQTQAVTSGWQSDAPAVATVTGSGTVTGVSNGEATIFVVFGGRQGSKLIRVAPDYDGRWTGMQVVTACSASGDFEGICEDEDFAVVGMSFPVALNARHPGALDVSGEFTIEDVEFPSFSTRIEPDGSVRFSSTLVVEGVTATGDWNMNAVQNGRATGTIRETYSIPGELDGEVAFESNLASFARTTGVQGDTRARTVVGVKRRVGRR